jgi:hypothetical protein
MINRRSVPPPTAHACISEIQPEENEPDGILRPDPLKTDMTAGLALSVGHGGFTDRFARHDFHSEALRHETSNAHARFLKRQLSLPVSTMSQ